MKKLLILIVAGALYFHFYPNEELNTWLLEQKSMVLSSFSEATDTNVKLKADKVYQDLSKDFSQFTVKEKTYVAEITSSHKKIKYFYERHCKISKQTPRLHRENLKKVCKAISQYSHLL